MIKSEKLMAGDIVLIKFPFTNLKSEKKRPSLILNCSHFSKSIDLVVIAMITSKLDGLKLKGDLLLQDWANAGLLHPSLLRLSKIATLESELIERKLGILSSKDQKLVKQVFQGLFAHWIK